VCRLYPYIQPFPLEPRQEEGLDAGSDDEALEALEAALGKLPTSGGEPQPAAEPAQKSGEQL
jgi:hypothetical protein